MPEGAKEALEGDTDSAMASTSAEGKKAKAKKASPKKKSGKSADGDKKRMPLNRD